MDVQGRWPHLDRGSGGGTDARVRGRPGQRSEWADRAGHTGARDDIDAAAWFSRDGRTWKAVPLPGERIKGPGRQGLVSAVPVDGKLLAVAFDVPPYGGGFYTLEIDLPK